MTTTQTISGSEPYTPDNLLDRVTGEQTLQLHYRHLERREHSILARRLALSVGRVLSVGCGWNPGRHLFPAPGFHLTGVDLDAHKVQGVILDRLVDHGFVGAAGELDDLPDRSFDIVFYRLVLHHIVFQQPLAPCFAEAARLLKPGGALVAIEPGLWHPIGLALAAANRFQVATALHGTPDDVPLSPRGLLASARDAGLTGELHAVTYTWRRLPRTLQRALQPLDWSLGSRPRAAALGHTLMLIARKPLS
ncbi:MAG: class I SAM-dependent methyltransferase [Solirubrobacteraceae bacterium]